MDGVLNVMSEGKELNPPPESRLGTFQSPNLRRIDGIDIERDRDSAFPPMGARPTSSGYAPGTPPNPFNDGIITNRNSYKRPFGLEVDTSTYVDPNHPIKPRPPGTPGIDYAPADPREITHGYEIDPSISLGPRNSITIDIGGKARFRSPDELAGGVEGRTSITIKLEGCYVYVFLTTYFAAGYSDEYSGRGGRLQMKDELIESYLLPFCNRPPKQAEPKPEEPPPIVWKPVQFKGGQCNGMWYKVLLNYSVDGGYDFYNKKYMSPSIRQQDIFCRGPIKSIFLKEVTIPRGPTLPGFYYTYNEFFVVCNGLVPPSNVNAAIAETPDGLGYERYPVADTQSWDRRPFYGQRNVTSMGATVTPLRPEDKDICGDPPYEPEPPPDIPWQVWVPPPPPPYERRREEKMECCDLIYSEVRRLQGMQAKNEKQRELDLTAVHQKLDRLLERIGNPQIIRILDENPKEEGYQWSFKRPDNLFELLKVMSDSAEQTGFAIGKHEYPITVKVDDSWLQDLDTMLSDNIDQLADFLKFLDIDTYTEGLPGPLRLGLSLLAPIAPKDIAFVSKWIIDRARESQETKKIENLTQLIKYLQQDVADVAEAQADSEESDIFPLVIDAARFGGSGEITFETKEDLYAELVVLGAASAKQNATLVDAAMKTVAETSHTKVEATKCYILLNEISQFMDYSRRSRIFEIPIQYTPEQPKPSKDIGKGFNAGAVNDGKGDAYLMEDFFENSNAKVGIDEWDGEHSMRDLFIEILDALAAIRPGATGGGITLS